MPQPRSPEEIRAAVENTRQELVFSINDLNSKVTELTNWRHQLAQNRKQALIAAGVAGFMVGGGIAATFGLFRRRR